MICVSIGRGRHRHVIAEHRHLVDQGAKLVELRRGLHQRRGEPAAAGGRPALPGDRHLPPRGRRRQVHRQRGAAAVVVADGDCRGGGVRRSGGGHCLGRFRVSAAPSGSSACTTSARRPTTSTRSTAGCASSIPTSSRSATMANHPHDNLRMLELTRRSKVPTVGLCMGDIGIPSRILAGKFGAPFTYATFHHERALAPGQLSYQQMTEIYHYDQINAETEVYGVIADPIGHSLSPQIHNAGFRHCGLNKVYVPIRVPREDLARFIDDAPALGHQGPERHHSAQGGGGQEAHRGRRRRARHRRRQHRRLRGREAAGLQHRLPGGHGQPGSGHRRRRGGSNAACKGRRPWCSAPAAWARPSSTG